MEKEALLQKKIKEFELHCSGSVMQKIFFPGIRASGI